MLSCFSLVRLFATPWTVAVQASLSMGFSRQEYWSGLLFPPPGDLSNPGIEPESPTLQVDSLPLNHQGSPKYCIRDKKWKYRSTDPPGCPASGCPWCGLSCFLWPLWCVYRFPRHKKNTCPCFSNAGFPQKLRFPCSVAVSRS